MLASNFYLNNIGEADVVLGNKITKTSDDLMLSQEYYIEHVWVL